MWAQLNPTERTQSTDVQLAPQNGRGINPPLKKIEEEEKSEESDSGTSAISPPIQNTPRRVTNETNESRGCGHSRESILHPQSRLASRNLIISH